jgi:4-carboxymuconolactone decarboxylase
MRLSPIDRDDLNDEQRTVLEAIESGPRGEGRAGIGMIGPFGAWVRAPSVGRAIQGAGEAIRFNTSLPPNIQEVAICTVGVHHQSHFEFSAHRALAIKAGVTERALDQLTAGEHPDFSGDEQLSYSIASQLLNQHRILDDTYAHGLEVFGETAMIELITTVGYYCLISLTLNAFEIPLEPGMKDPFAEAIDGST